MVLSKEYIENIREQSGIVFETVLDFVKLPYWKPAGSAAKMLDHAQGHSNDQGDRKTDANGDSKEADPYTAIFKWLWDGGVRKVFTLDVDDDGPEAHTNAAIRKALTTYNFEIEVWDWKKFDICCETVAAAAPAARQVHLYSHGNTAVLRGWACGLSLGKMREVSETPEAGCDAQVTC